MSDKTAVTSVPVHPPIAQRWSPRAFADRDVEPEAIVGLLEAARWAPSCFNEQPWRFIVAPRSDAAAHAALASTLAAANAVWASKAPLLLLSVAKAAFARNAKPNRHAWHDVGLAVENLVLQAQAMGLGVHQMAGFDVAKAREVAAIPAGYDPVAMIAVGHPGDPAGLPEELRQREAAPRTRLPLDQIAFTGTFGTPFVRR